MSTTLPQTAGHQVAQSFDFNSASCHTRAIRMLCPFGCSLVSVLPDSGRSSPDRLALRASYVPEIEQPPLPGSWVAIRAGTNLPRSGAPSSLNSKFLRAFSRNLGRSPDLSLTVPVRPNADLTRRRSPSGESRD